MNPKENLINNSQEANIGTDMKFILAISKKTEEILKIGISVKNTSSSINKIYSSASSLYGRGGLGKLEGDSTMIENNGVCGSMFDLTPNKRTKKLIQRLKESDIKRTEEENYISFKFNIKISESPNFLIRELRKKIKKSEARFRNKLKQERDLKLKERVGKDLQKLYEIFKEKGVSKSDILSINRNPARCRARAIMANILLIKYPSLSGRGLGEFLKKSYATINRQREKFNFTGFNISIYEESLDSVVNYLMPRYQQTKKTLVSKVQTDNEINSVPLLESYTQIKIQKRKIKAYEREPDELIGYWDPKNVLSRDKFQKKHSEESIQKIKDKLGFLYSLFKLKYSISKGLIWTQGPKGNAKIARSIIFRILSEYHNLRDPEIGEIVNGSKRGTVLNYKKKFNSYPENYEDTEKAVKHLFSAYNEKK